MLEDEINQSNEIDLNQLLVVLNALRQGDLSLRMPVNNTGIANEVAVTLNEIIDMNTKFATEIVKVTKDFGVDGNLGTKANTAEFEGTWKDLIDCLNMMILILGAQFRNIADVTYAVSRRDMTKKITVDANGQMLLLKNNINEMVDQLAELESAVKKITSSPNN